MRHDVTMPQLGMAQDAGRIVAWLKAAGDTVAKGDALFEVETDKATMEVEAQASGFLTGITAQEGEDVPVGAVIARISDSAEDDSPTPAPDLDVQDAIDRLPEKQRLCVVLHYLEGLPTNDIAAMLRLPHSTVRGRLMQARKALKLQLMAGEEAPHET